MPDFSLVLPLYNEETTVRRVASDLVSELRSGGFIFELMLVENGSRDSTGREVQLLRERFPEIRLVRVERNEGYGLGVLQGLEAATGRTIGFMGGDGQVSSGDARRVLEAARANPGSLVKARRIHRFDGFLRVLNSAIFNVLMRLCFGKLSPDINGTPKLFPREWLPAMRLKSKDWFLDAEVMLRVAALGKDIVEVDVSFGKRESGSSHVRVSSILEFLRNIARYRFGGERTAWRRREGA